jgi:hypothetical protein
MKPAAMPAAPPVYRPDRSVPALARPFDPRKLSAPPVYRPQPQATAQRPALAQMKPAATPTAPPVYRPDRGVPVLARPLQALLSSGPAVLQRNGNKKQEKKKAAKKQAEQSKQSKTDRNQFRLVQYQTPAKGEVQVNRLKQAAALGTQGVNIAHGFGGGGSGVSSKGQGLLKAINTAEMPGEKASKGSQFSQGGKKSAKSGKPRMPGSQFSDTKRKISVHADQQVGRSGIEGAKEAYLDYCRRAFAGYAYTEEQFQEWADEWARGQEEESVVILDEHPGKGPSHEDKSDGDGDGPPGFSALGGGQQVISVGS